MTLVNAAYAGLLTWANHLLDTLEVQALTPMFGEQPIEMGMAGREDVALLLEPADRCAHGRTAHSVAVRDLGFDDACAGCQATADDGIAQLPVHLSDPVGVSAGRTGGCATGPAHGFRLVHGVQYP